MSQVIATSHPVSLGLLDGSMPDMDGYTLAARLKDLPILATMPLLMLTSTCQPWDMQHGQEVGITVSLTKPVSQSRLWNTIATVLGTSGEPPVAPVLTAPDNQLPPSQWHLLLAYVAKPLCPQELVTAIERLLTPLQVEATSGSHATATDCSV